MCLDITVVIEQMLKLFLLICLGVFLAHIQILDIYTKKKLTKLMLHVTTPMMIIDAFHDRLLMLQEQPTDASALSVPYLFAMSFLFYALLIFLSFVVILPLHIPKEERCLYLFMTIFGNVGFMGFPVVSAVYGNEGLFYAAILNCVFNIIIYTFGVVLMTVGNQNEKPLLQSTAWKKLLLSPAVLCSVVAVIIFSCHIQLPAVLADTLDTIGGLTSPLAMLVVGANLYGMRLREMLKDWRMNCYVLLRQFAMPLLFWILLRRFTQHAMLTPVWLLLSGMPVANTTALFATEYGGNEKLASKCIFLTTLCSLVSFPLVIWICCR